MDTNHEKHHRRWSLQLCGSNAIHIVYGPVTLHIPRQDLPHLMLGLVRMSREMIAKGLRGEESEAVLH
ncbi:MAG: hypothetical protein HYW02_03990 [Deltaproteobacteria bacterium]|nr:hypothetical protein [Deltaproteobacteria bacterium]MBI2500626.1 hypothetical protein [Deltaproteobacteria bacterium]